MFDDVPPRIWLLLLILVAAYIPARYIFDHITHAPSRQDITQPPKDLSWRKSSVLVRNLAIIVGLCGLAIFIFTATAEQLAQSPYFWPIIMAIIGAWALYSVQRGIATGRIEPLVRGVSMTFERSTQPKRFWASVGWNATFGGLCFWLGFIMMQEGRSDLCYDPQEAHEPHDVVMACSELIDARGGRGDDLAILTAARGYAYHRATDWNNALKDYSDAIRLDPGDTASLFNRALILDRIDERSRALQDYSAVLRLRPNDFDARIKRGILLGELKRFKAAEADFTRAHELKPENISVLAFRGLTYAWMKDRARAEQDFKTVLVSDPASPIVKQGRAVLEAQERRP